MEDNRGGVVLCGTLDNGLGLLHRVIRDATGALVQEQVGSLFGPWNSGPGGFDLPALPGRVGERGYGVALVQRRNGMFLPAANVGVPTDRGVSLLDTDTLTHVSMQPLLTPQYARALPTFQMYVTHLF